MSPDERSRALAAARDVLADAQCDDEAEWIAPVADPTTLPWRVGRRVGRTVYAQLGAEPSDEDVLIGVMDTRALAEDVVWSHNAMYQDRRALVARRRIL